MAIQYCAPVECSSCAGIGELLDDHGIRTCKQCHGVGSLRVQCAREDIEILNRAVEGLILDQRKRPDWLLPVAMSVACSITSIVLTVWALLAR